MARLLNLKISLFTAVFAVVALGLALVLFTDGGANRSGTATVASVSSPAVGSSTSSTSAVKAVTSSSQLQRDERLQRHAHRRGLDPVDEQQRLDRSRGGAGGRGFGGSGSGSSQSTALGSGILLDTKGDILTNEHVVDKATKVTVSFDTKPSTTRTARSSAPTPPRTWPW